MHRIFYELEKWWSRVLSFRRAALIVLLVGCEFKWEEGYEYYAILSITYDALYPTPLGTIFKF